MNRRSLFALLGAPLLLTALGAQAANVRLSASEIEALLTGNTIIGTWSGAAYRQYFAADGTTIYQPESGKQEEGRWRVNPQTNDYESWWRSTGWMPFALVRTGAGGLAWVNGDRLEPFEIRAGRQIE